MATINNVILPNVAKGPGNEDWWPQIWALTRAMKKAGWKVLASSDGTTKTNSDDPALDEWGAGVTTGVSGTDGTLGATAGGRITFTAGSGTPFTSSDKGRFLSITGGAVAANNHYHQIEEVTSNTVVRLDARRTAFTPTDSGETNNGSLNYEVFDPTTETVAGGLATVRAWLLMQGPSTIKIPIGAAPAVGGTSGVTFMRGENVTQATTNAEGEILGWVYDADTTTGYLVVLPRIIGTGTDPYGWDDTYTITGDSSGSTVDQDGDALEYRQQVVFTKTTDQNQGWLFHQCIEPVGESADSFKTLAAAAGCTATIQPGGGGTSNDFPAIGYYSCGDSSLGDSKWNGSNGAVNAGNAQIICLDTLWEEDYSADGTWQIYVASLGTTGSPAGGRGFYRCDDTEPGDLDPFVVAGISQETMYAAATRTGAYQSTAGGADDAFSTAQHESWTNGTTFWRGWRRRGLGTNDDFSCFELANLWICQSANDQLMQYNSGDADKVATEPIPTKVREPVWVVAMVSGAKMRKGTVRALSIVQGGNAWDTYDEGRFIQLTPDNGCMIAGPWDETSVPTPS